MQDMVRIHAMTFNSKDAYSKLKEILQDIKIFLRLGIVSNYM